MRLSHPNITRTRRRGGRRGRKRLTYVVPQSDEQRRHGQQPEHRAEGLGHAPLDAAGLGLEMEGEGDGDGDDGHVDGEAKVGEECWLFASGQPGA